MSPSKKKLQKKSPAFSGEIDLRHHVGAFNLDLIEPRGPAAISHYEDALLTADEKAEYYEDLVQNGGEENAEKIVKDCKNKAEALRNKIAGMDSYDVNPVIEDIKWLESLAQDYENLVPPEVLASQKSEKSDGFKLTPELKRRLYEMGLKQYGDRNPEPSIDEKTDDEPEGMRELKRKAAFWKNIHSWGMDQIIPYYFCGSKKPPDWIEAMFVRAQKDGLAVKMISAQIGRPMLMLLRLAEMGNEPAALEAIKLLEIFVSRLNTSAKLNQKTFKNVGSKLLAWPVIYSPHPRLDQSKGTIAREIDLGGETEFEFWPGAEWNPRDTACKIAMELYRHIEKIRQYPNSNTTSRFFDEAQKLPPIKTANGVKAWWHLAQKIFDNSYPNPKTVPLLGKLTNRTDRGKANSKIREILKNRFFSLFRVEYR